jgi:hypothetical protein
MEIIAKDTVAVIVEEIESAVSIDSADKASTTTKPFKISNDIRKRIVGKIHRYIHLNKFIDNEIEYIQRIFEMDISENKKQISENEAGMLLVVNEYSDETFKHIMDFLVQCEANWTRKVKEDKSFIQTKNKHTSTTTTNKKAETIINPLIHTNEQGEDSNSDPEDPEEANNSNIDGDNEMKCEKRKNTKLTAKLKIMDNKKHPLAYYKGSLNRIMRTARNIGILQGIPEHTKKYTSEILGFGNDNAKKSEKKVAKKRARPRTVINIKNPELVSDDKSREIDCESCEEGSDNFSDVGEDDLASLSRKYSKFNADGNEEGEEEGEEDDEEDEDQEFDEEVYEEVVLGDYDNEVEVEDDEEIDECIEEDDIDDEDDDDQDSDEIFSDDD